jgi:hypothetical protein
MIHFYILLSISAISAIVFVFRRISSDDWRIDPTGSERIQSPSISTNAISSTPLTNENLYYQRRNRQDFSEPYSFQLKLDDDIQLFKSELRILLKSDPITNTEFPELISDENIQQLKFVSDPSDFKNVFTNLLDDCGLIIPQSFVFGEPYSPIFRGIDFNNSDKKFHLLQSERHGLESLYSTVEMEDALYVAIPYLSFNSIQKLNFEKFNSNVKHLVHWAVSVRNMSCVNRGFGKRAYSLFRSDLILVFEMFSISFKDFELISDAELANRILIAIGVPQSDMNNFSDEKTNYLTKRLPT